MTPKERAKNYMRLKDGYKDKISIKEKDKTTEELLEIFKKEKGL